MGHILANVVVLRINLNIDGALTLHTLKPLTRPLTSTLSLGVPVPPYNPVYVSSVDPSDLALQAFSLSLHRHSYISILFSSRFISS